MSRTRRCVLAAVWCAGSLGPGAAAAAEDDSSAAAAAVQAFHDAIKTGDAAAAMAWLAPGATVLEQGTVESRADYASHHLAADIAFAKRVPTQRAAIQTQVVGDVAWVSSSSHTQGSFEGNAVNLAGAELVVLTRNGSRWLIQAVHWSSRKQR